MLGEGASASVPEGQVGTMPASKKDQLEAKIAEDPRVAGPWLQLIELTREGGQLDDIRDTYERFFEYFPQASAQWMQYVDLELAHSNFDNVDDIFTRCLRSTLSVDLWKLYLSYTRRVHPVPPPTGEENSERDQVRRTLEEAYEFALKFIGWDRESSSIWQDYIQLIREREAKGTWQEGQKMDQLRRAFQSAVVVPLNQVESIWRDYDAYETSLNKLTAKKFLGERSPAYMQARTVLRELKQLTDALERPSLPSQPAWLVANGRTAAQDKRAFKAWHRYLEWEESNPLSIDDTTAFQHRVLSAYKQCVMYARFDPVLWYMAANYCQKQRLETERLVWLRNGIDACPWSVLLRFTYAESCRAQGRYSDATAALDDLVEYTQKQLDLRLRQLARAEQQIEAEIAKERTAQLQKRNQVDSAPDEEEADKVELADIERRLQEEREKRCAIAKKEAQAVLDLWQNAVSQVWIKYMQFVRRAEGIRPTRQIFGRARKSPHCSWEVYEANAMLEYYCSKDPVVATKVFELALKTFGPNEHLVVRYLKFLLSINDDTNARALLERTVHGMPPEKARVVWMSWAEHEYSYGDASAIARLESRLHETYPDLSVMECASMSLRYHNLDSVRSMDMGDSADAILKPKAQRSSRGEVEDKAEETSAAANPEKEPTNTSSQPAKAEAAGRQTMEEIRRSLVTSSEPVKRTRAKAEDKPSKKSKSSAASDTLTRKAARDTPPPPPFVLPDAILYFMKYVSITI